jgi:hypothetical protein
MRHAVSGGVSAPAPVTGVLGSAGAAGVAG